MTQSIEDLAGKILDKLNIGVKLRDTQDILINYKGDDWKKYLNFCKDGYTRNVAYRDDKIEILILCWSGLKESGVHDHPENGCIVRLLKGKLIEKIYKMDDGKLKFVNENTINKNSTSYQEGKKGLHSIGNPYNKCAVTIHVYSPPFYKPKFYL